MSKLIAQPHERPILSWMFVHKREPRGIRNTRERIIDALRLGSMTYMEMEKETERSYMELRRAMTSLKRRGIVVEDGKLGAHKLFKLNEGKST